jgi:hypothetical protein
LVTFSIYEPKASEITVGGDFTSGAPAPVLTKNENGVWMHTSLRFINNDCSLFSKVNISLCLKIKLKHETYLFKI